jgi:hypothetical protein
MAAIIAEIINHKTSEMQPPFPELLIFN